VQVTRAAAGAWDATWGREAGRACGQENVTAFNGKLWQSAKID